MTQIFFKFYFMNGRLDFISIIDFSVFPIMVMSCWSPLVRKCHAPPCCLLFFKKYLFNASYNKQNFLIAGPFQKFLWSPNWLPRGLPDSRTYILSLTDSRFSKTDSSVGDLTPSGACMLQRFLEPCYYNTMSSTFRPIHLESQQVANKFHVHLTGKR